ncbi:hypothetical protein D0T11_15680 [Hymenobacter rubripertinctus]|uniref:Uncharacterized protein n=1 Tax=Hymenobacter rubripertinctus TaxID=2029981 RepID=A0A418QRB6_9BACT|nr:hypothetical protein D0T11_15680 [Hymenobacter rubripertinctus]
MPPGRGIRQKLPGRCPEAAFAGALPSSGTTAAQCSCGGSPAFRTCDYLFSCLPDACNRYAFCHCLTGAAAPTKPAAFFCVPSRNPLPDLRESGQRRAAGPAGRRLSGGRRRGGGGPGGGSGPGASRRPDLCRPLLPPPAA